MGAGKGRANRAQTSTPAQSVEVYMDDLRTLNWAQRQAAISAGAGEISHDESRELFRELVERIKGRVLPGMRVEVGEHGRVRDGVEPHEQGSVREVDDRDGSIWVIWDGGASSGLPIVADFKLYEAEKVEEPEEDHEQMERRIGKITPVTF